MNSRKSLPRELALQLRDVRRELGLSQKEVARRAALSQSHVSRIEGGKDLQVSTLLRLATVLGLEFVLLPRSAKPVLLHLLTPPEQRKESVIDLLVVSDEEGEL